MGDDTPVQERLSALEAQMQDLGRDLQMLRSLSTEDVQSTLNKMRYITEKCLHDLCRQSDVGWGKSEPTLENMIGPLVAASAIPKPIAMHVRSVQTYASPGSHYQEQSLSFEHVRVALMALVEFLEWFHRRGGAESAPAITPVAAAPKRNILMVHALPPARQFEGRAEIVARLERWFAEGAAVQAIVGVGGSGKTSLLAHVLPHAQGSIFGWSFYDDPRSDAFIAAALDFAGAPKGPSTADRLTTHLAKSPPFMFVLDGLETMQSEGTRELPRGRLTDTSLRHLMRSIAGGLGQTRALVMSRFPLVDLEPWLGKSAQMETLSDLEPRAALIVLRSWGVKGDDASLLALAERVGRHALSLAVIGSYLSSFCDGDPSAMNDLGQDEMDADEPLAHRLFQVLNAYTSALPPLERDLLIRLSLFPGGIDMPLVELLSKAPPEVAGALKDQKAPVLRMAIKKLVSRGLAFDDGERASAHAFLRQHFRGLLEVAAKDVHQAVCDGIQPTLVDAPRYLVRDPVLVERYERFAEHLRLAGKHDRAYEVMQQTLGGFFHLGADLGQFARGLRLTAGFVGDPAAMAALPARERALLLRRAAQFAIGAGQLEQAEHWARAAVDALAADDDSGAKVVAIGALAEIERLKGDLSAALATIERVPPAGYLPHLAAYVLNRLGQVERARESVMAPSTSQSSLWASDPLIAIYQGLYALETGQLDLARDIASEVLKERSASELDRMRAQAIIGRSSLGRDEATNSLPAIEAYAAKTGHAEIVLLALQLRAEIESQNGNRESAIATAQRARSLASAQGFGLLEGDLSVFIARCE
jgi:hypothetical protein